MTTTSNTRVKSAAKPMLRITTSHWVRLMMGLRTFVNGAQVGMTPPSEVGVSERGRASKSKMVLDAEDGNVLPENDGELGARGDEKSGPAVMALTWLCLVGDTGTASVEVGEKGLGERGSATASERVRGGTDMARPTGGPREVFDSRGAPF